MMKKRNLITLKTKVMKNKLYILCIGLLIGLSSCSDDFVQVDPTTLITDSQVWQDQNLVDAFLNNVYNNLEFVDLTGEQNFNQVLIASMRMELKVGDAWQNPYKRSVEIINPNGAHRSLGYFKWAALRDCNLIIKKLTIESKLPQGFIDKKIAEARFLRAYIYFEMVKRYGGMPIITDPQDIDTPVEELFASRNSEQEVYDFIISDLEEAAQNLSTTASAASGRATKWAALALLTRAATYAGSIGEFGDMQLDGLLGIPDPQPFWQKAYDTANMIINESGHGLYKKHGDKAVNFQNLFTDEDNTEVIFSQKFDTDLKGHNWSVLSQPKGILFNRGWCANYHVFWDTVKLFDFVDGSSGAISDSELTSRRWSSDALFGQRDPRFRASVFYPEAPWKGSLYTSHENTTNMDSAPEGWSKRSQFRNRKHTGFLVRKRIDERLVKPPINSDGTDYIVFRLGEVYLNLAEAAFHLNLVSDATMAINTLRNRAGMPDRVGLTWENIMQERRCELFAEDQTYWDLRRWRVAEQEIEGRQLKGLRFYYDGITRDYRVTVRIPETVKRRFQERNYYLPIGIYNLIDNPSLVENPGY